MSSTAKETLLRRLYATKLALLSVGGIIVSIAILVGADKIESAKG